jgi:hypothetical protein
VAVEGRKGVGGLFEHLLGHRDRIDELLEIERGDTLRSRQGYNLIVDEAEKVLD